MLRTTNRWQDQIRTLLQNKEQPENPGNTQNHHEIITKISHCSRHTHNTLCQGFSRDQQEVSAPQGANRTTMGMTGAEPGTHSTHSVQHQFP